MEKEGNDQKIYRGRMQFYHFTPIPIIPRIAMIEKYTGGDEISIGFTIIR